jgi:excisionase family DNA binding protein
MENRSVEEHAVEKHYFSYSEAMQYCGLGRTLLTQLVTSGSIPASRVNRRVLISRAGLDEFLRSNKYAEIGGSAACSTGEEDHTRAEWGLQITGGG